MIITERKLRRIIRNALLIERDVRLRGSGETPAEFDAKQIAMWQMGYEHGKKIQTGEMNRFNLAAEKEYRDKFGSPGIEYFDGRSAGVNTYGPAPHPTDPDYTPDENYFPKKKKKKKRKAEPVYFDEPEYGDEEEELTIADTLPPAHYALAIGTDSDVYEGDRFKVSPVQTDADGTRYRWWKWGNLIDPIAFVLDPGDEDYRDFKDQDGKIYTPEQLFQALAGGKTSRFKFPKELYV
tara:strand:+ start:890 stop:1600 length:711 start_codon:yes stop_codon:yes gene_type:complete